MSRRVRGVLAAAIPLFFVSTGTAASCDDCQRAELLLILAEAVEIVSGAPVQTPVVAQDERFILSRFARGEADLVLMVGDTFEVTGTEANRGERSAGDHSMALVQRDIEDEDLDQLLEEFPIPGLGVDDTATRRALIEAVEEGIAIFELVADYRERVRECREGNNGREVVTPELTAIVDQHRSSYLIVRVVSPNASLEPSSGMDLPQARFRVLK